MNKRWFAVRTKSNRELTTAGCLLGQGYETFLPMYKPGTHHTAQKVTQKPLFPGYLFCRFDFQNRLAILQNSGVVHIVSVGKTPAPLCDEEIESLKIVVESEAAIARHPSYVAGQIVRVTQGPLAGAQGTIVQNDSQLLVVSITLLQRSVSVTVAKEWLESAVAAN